MATRQKTAPNLAVPAIRGWCLMYVDDAGGAPKTNPPRVGSAQAAWEVEKRNGNTRAGDPPVGLWVPGFLSLNVGQFKGLGHVFWMFNHGNGWIEIRDSETATNARPAYRSVAEVVAWFGRYSPTYLGWSYWVDGIQAVEDYVPAPSANGSFIAHKGVATVTVDALNVRNDPSNDHAIVATYVRGQVFNYDGYIISDGFVWLSYVSYSGVRRYIAEGPADGNPNNVYVSGGVG